MSNTLSIENNIKAEDLKAKLKETNLSEDQIQEVIPVILKTLSEVKEIENKKTEDTTKEDLSNLTQSIENNSNVSIDMKNNKWTVIGAMNFNTITNNITITINQPTTQREPQATAQREPQPTAQREPQSTTQRESQSTAQREPQSTTQRESQSTAQREPQSTTQRESQPTAQRESQSTAQRESQSTTQREPQPTTQREPQATAQRESQSTTQRESQSTTQREIELNSYEWYDKALSQLIFEIDWCLKTAKYRRWLNKSWKETLKTATEKLKQYKDIIHDKKRMLEHEYKEKNKLNAKNPDKAPLTLSISGAEINELKNRRFERRQQIEIDIKEWQNGKSSNIAPWPNQSLEQVKKWNSVDNRHASYDSKLNEALRDSEFLHTIDNNQDRAKEFLQSIVNNSLSDSQIVFCQSHMQQLAPYFSQYGLTDQVHNCIQTRSWRYTQSINTYWNMDRESAYKTWWVIGVINKALIEGFPNAKPEQVSNLTNIAAAVGWIYAVYRIWKWFFSKSEIKDKNGEVIWYSRNLLWKTAGLAALYIVPQLLVWQDWYSLIWNILSWKADFWELGYRLSNCLWFLNNGDQETYSQIAPWVLWMSIFPQTYTVANIRSLQQTFSDQNVRKQRYSATYTRLNSSCSALANEFKNTFNANEYKEDERKAFLAKLWITDSTSWDTLLFNEAQRNTDKKTSLELWMKSQWKKKNPAFEKEIDEYLKQDWEFDPEKLNPNWFNNDPSSTYSERTEDINFKENLTNQVESLPIDSSKKSELKTAIQEFYDKRTIDTKPKLNDFYLSAENGKVVITSHSWQKTEIDIDKWELIWFWNWITFSDLSELLDVADLSNKILDSQKWKVAKDMPPFQYKIERKWICFNDATSIRQDIITRNNSWMDTRVLSTWRWWATSKINTLYNHPWEYADYLSKRWIDANKLKINLSLYPTIKWLSESWITFINEQEVKQAEVRLNKVKETRSTENGWTQWYKPFSIEWNKLVFSTSDTQSATKIYFPDQFPSNFSWKSQNLSNFPTILNNKDKFLNYMNDKRNWMRGSKLNQ